MMIPDNVKSIMQTLLDGGHEAYIIGGAVRDMLLGAVPSDWDLFTDASGDEILSLFPHGRIIGGDERQAKILTVIVDGVEVSQYRRNGDRTETGVSLDKHLSTCDFTINAVAMDIWYKITDPYQGRNALMSRHLECVGNPSDRLKEDKIRALRAIRFAVRYKMNVELPLRRVLSTLDFDGVPVERVREELLKIIRYEDGLQRVRGMYNLKGDLFTALQETYYLDGGHHHDETVYYHLQLAQNEACKLTDNSVLIFACAMHDIGKPATADFNESGKLTFHGHEKAGAEILKTIMQNMRFSKDDTKYATTLVAEHMYNRLDTPKTSRSLIKHFKRLEDAGISIDDHMIMLYSDNQANMKNPRVKFGDFIRDNLIYKKYYELKHSTTPFRISDLAISGNDMIDAGVPVGPQIGIELEDIFELVLCGELENKRHVLMHYIKNSMITDNFERRLPQ